jgi:hypothetical protein
MRRQRRRNIQSLPPTLSLTIPPRQPRVVLPDDAFISPIEEGDEECDPAMDRILQNVESMLQQAKAALDIAPTQYNWRRRLSNITLMESECELIVSPLERRRSSSSHLMVPHPIAPGSRRTSITKPDDLDEQTRTHVERWIEQSMSADIPPEPLEHRRRSYTIATESTIVVEPTGDLFTKKSLLDGVATRLTTFLAPYIEPYVEEKLAIRLDASPTNNTPFVHDSFLQSAFLGIGTRLW